MNAGLWEPTVDAKLTPRRREVLIDLFLSIYNKFILTDSKQRKVIICDKILLPMPIKTLIVDVLFRNFQVPTIHFASADLLALMALGRSSGIVVDIGHLETTVVPVFDGRPINQLVKFAPLGSQSLIDRLKLLIKNHASLTVSVPPQAPPPPPTSPSLSSQPVFTLLDQTMADQPPYFWSNLIAQTYSYLHPHHAWICQSSRLETRWGTMQSLIQLRRLQQSVFPRPRTTQNLC
ncbi:hypothetical protein BCR33DRAFT_681418 [Rhizoclosmatium globosum]|uniref:Actin-like ATPase domain-containing protein n=1 Tax=Rhizoclosmatium globosum TaxID=329046 RepID=A0A1Y2C1G3_9FUNG|nr:hypothetical protein BCR33DRAFT_681418 [Rhizoclosmatium globosum]|eukprot:ORY40145.1 hypothetical protein BCR33DRAFT_681418 [Rhizoclosmatium globosum]